MTSGMTSPVIQASAELATHPLLKFLPASTFLPVELLDVLNHTYFLHLLSTDPSKVVPPGKSVLSMMTKPHAAAGVEAHPALKAQVEEVVHKAFWDAAFEALSLPESGEQLARLKLLYNDLYDALQPLLPPNHRILLALSSPFEPTSAPLLSAVIHLRETLVALKERCAPLRDAYIEILLKRLSNPPSQNQTVELARLIIDSGRDILKLSEMMKDDLSQFVLGTMSEPELRGIIHSETRSRERGLILDLWKTPSIIAGLIQAWHSELFSPYMDVVVPPERRWVARLMQALAEPTPVACSLPTKLVSTADSSDVTLPSPLPNTLPPPFFFSTPALEYAQNLLQALVIVAALRALLPPDVDPSFSARVWTLLESSIESPYPSTDDTKLAHLADEVIRARGLVDIEEEARLRAAVSRTLQVQDPAFALLQRRLITALEARLAEVPQPLRSELPSVMRAGRHRPEVSAGVNTARSREDEAVREWEGFYVKGFEDALVKEKVRETGARLRKEVRWLEEVWGKELQIE
ncbi:hypothetical protein K488DRAFT_82634 [Vararia minispora EC-137]|uniref:Uncharacterized protein n=1 Tax=Vararia minispora EC-137 TaxID=1314806 RepID=A0ACB8QVD6_9AGAM|nr:hypothetical protein K488DRAFT_82634 [Vararia minispora EC-137]